MYLLDFAIVVLFVYDELVCVVGVMFDTKTFVTISFMQL